ncbi:hypothetical protein, partial [Rosenbergiella collisarenosi]|uniref:hypothetical protein n=1 Tax=Rosenbergiella collisarenosi TaxID=1544695 RepID=UPI001F500F28
MSDAIPTNPSGLHTPKNRAALLQNTICSGMAGSAGRSSRKVTVKVTRLIRIFSAVGVLLAIIN